MQNQFLPLKIFICLILLQCLSSQVEDISGDYNKYISFHWKGAITSHSIIIKAFPQKSELQANPFSAFLFVYKRVNNKEIQLIQTFALNFSPGQNSVAEVQINSLAPKTTYYYSYLFSHSNILQKNDFIQYYEHNKVTEFTFRTLELALNPMNFTFGAASCADTGSTSSVFLNLKDENLTFFLHMGDIHYENIDTDNITKFYEGYYKTFQSPSQKQFFQSVPVFYIWDDHDFGADNSNGKSPTKDAVHQAYKEFVPYGPLKAKFPVDDFEAFPIEATKSITESDQYTLSYESDGPYGIFRSFIVGRCLFIVMDLRSFKDVIPNDILGKEQKVWLENQFKFVSLNERIKVVFLVSTIFWIDNKDEGEWSDYLQTQTLIANWAKKYVKNAGKQIMVLSGDTHAMAFDDGRNNYIGEFPVLQAAPLDSFPICSGGPYSHGVSVDRGQYSVIEVQDLPNDNVCIKIHLKKLGASLIQYDTCYPNSYPGTEGVPCPKLIVGDAKGYGWIILIIVGVLIGAAVLVWIVWKCLKRYKERKFLKKEKPLIELTESFVNR